MARLPRLSVAGVPQHVVQRGNNRQACFFDNQDYAVYLDKLKEYSVKQGVHVHSYILMTNHVHLLMTPQAPQGISRLMQDLGRYYVRYVNQTYKRTGTLWEGRYKSSLIDSERYFLTVSRYIELNPVRAKMVDHPSGYPWSSYQRNALGKAIELITPHACYQALGASDEGRREVYRALFEQHLPGVTLTEIREATNKSWVLGEEHFKKQIESQTGRRAAPLTRGGDRKSKQYRVDVEDQLL
ncbi:MAG: transposase [Gammaproteobacteria bacterium]|nr:transposase [Gammaproteobacteria bacterium]